jgi:hypothetical protein
MSSLLSIAAHFATVTSSRQFSYAVREYLDRFRERPSQVLLRDAPVPLIETLPQTAAD